MKRLRIDALAAAAVWAALSLGLVAFSALADPDPRPIAARVLWWRGDRVYAASLDSTLVSPGQRLTILDGKKPLATAEVTDVFEGEIVAARLTSGSLARVKKLERLRVLAETPVVPSAPLLRVGYSRARPTAFDACDRLRLADLWRGRYRCVDSTAAGFRLIRREEARDAGTPWPDTLVVRVFDDVADLEIALERADLDAGVFWPGEASTHIREALHWSDREAGLRSRGVVTIDAGDDSTALDSLSRSATLASDLDRLNREMFRGDLLPLGPAAPAARAGRSSPDRIRYAARGPGASAIEAFLNRGGASEPTPPGAAAVSIEYRDEPPDSGDSPYRRRVFAIRCPVIASPRVRAAVRALGAGALANLFDCVPEDRR